MTQQSNPALRHLACPEVGIMSPDIIALDTWLREHPGEWKVVAEDGTFKLRARFDRDYTLEVMRADESETLVYAVGCETLFMGRKKLGRLINQKIDRIEKQKADLEKGLRMVGIWSIVGL